MRVLGALGVTFALMVTGGLLNVVTDTPWFGLLVALATALWAAVDASQLKLHKYSGGIDHPILAFLAISCLWIVFFPLYLVIRSRRLAGELKLKKKYCDQMRRESVRG
jgi:uncharacterized membrane protein YccC